MRSLLAMFLLWLSMPASASAAMRQSFDLRVLQAPMVATIGGNRQLVYELHLANYADTGLLPTRLDVLDADAAGKPLASWRGAALLARIAVAGNGKPPDAAQGLAPGMHAVVYIEVELPAGATVPRRLTHRLAYAASAQVHAQGEVSGGSIAVVRRAPLTVAPPLRGGPWIAVYGASFARGHRRVLFALDGQVRIPARFAIDWIRLDAQGRHANGDEHAVANWLGYGEDVLAVADGTVVATRDGYPESRTLENPRHPLGEGSGNFISLALGDGRYAHYEHLKPGSVRVHPGDRVHRGQVIAALGFTGDSTGPHLHFHVSDGAAPLAGEGLPFVIDRYELLGGYPDLEDFAAGKPWQPLPAGDIRARSGDMPAPSAVVDFRE
ncbi:MAG: M23 family metallopeptidase [Rhodanobacter sp.]